MIMLMSVVCCDSLSQKRFERASVVVSSEQKKLLLNRDRDM